MVTVFALMKTSVFYVFTIIRVNKHFKYTSTTQTTLRS